MIIGDKCQRLLLAFAEGRDCAPLHGWENREACPNLGVTIKQTVVLGGSRVWGLFVALRFEHELCNLLRDIDGDRLHGLRVDVETKQKDTSSTDYRCQD